jgi:hypothetical protein
LLARCVVPLWTDADALSWWNAHLGELERVPASNMAEKTLVISPRHD